MIRWLLLLPVWFSFNLIAILFAPLLPLFAVNTWGEDDNGHATSIAPRLPWWLSWFGTPDNSLLGDAGHKARWPHGGYGQKVAWLLRNPAYGFERDGPLAAHITAEMDLVFLGDPAIKNRSAARAGKLWICIWNSRRTYWCEKRVTRPFFGSDLCLMWEFGWKLQPYAQDPAALSRAPRAQFVCSIRFTSFLP